MEESALVKQLSIPLYQSRSWLKMLGILSILYGVLSAMTIIWNPDLLATNLAGDSAPAGG